MFTLGYVLFAMLMRNSSRSGMGDWFMIQTSNGLVLDIAGAAQGGRLTIFQAHGGDNQLWRFEDGCLVSKVGLVADIMGGDRNTGAGVIASTRHGEINQKWSLQGNLIQSKMTGLVMEVKDGKMVSGTEVTMMDKRESSNQKWFMYSV